MRTLRRLTRRKHGMRLPSSREARSRGETVSHEAGFYGCRGLKNITELRVPTLPEVFS